MLLPLTHDVHHGLNGCVSTHVSFSQTRKAHMAWGSAPLLPRQEFCHRVLDPQQLVGSLRQKHWTFSDFAIRQLVHMSSVFVRMTSVTLLLVRMNSVNLDSCESPARTLFFDEFCESSARTHDFGELCESSARTHELCEICVNLLLVRMNFVKDLRLDEVHTIFLDQVFRLSPYFRKSSLARCVSVPFSHKEVTLRIGCVTTTTRKYCCLRWFPICSQILRFP